MQLYIVRHGIAIDREDPKCPPEAERYLTEEGIERTRQVAKGIAALGAHADLLIVDGDPLKDITELQKVKFVMKGGAVYKNELH